MKVQLFVATIFISLLLTGCAPQPGAIPTVEEVIEQRDHISLDQAEVECNKYGGKFETWQDNNIYCVFPQGYGCDPIQFYRRICYPPSME